jgi:hypothetical protein
MDLRSFAKYVADLEDLAHRVLRRQSLADDGAKISAALNGGPARALRRSVSLQERQEAGVFFTGPSLSDEVLDRATLNPDAVYLDPACGTGDLLLKSASYLPVKKTLRETLDNWGDRLGGMDLHQEFIRAARARLVLFAASRVEPRRSTKLDLDSLLPRLRCADAMENPVDLEKSTHVLLNPPYTRTKIPRDCSWAQGKTTSAAALFVERYLMAAHPGTRLWAILPDVLRTGTQYSRWRVRVESLSKVEEVSVWGAFDSTADVDVFILRATATSATHNEEPPAWWVEDGNAGERIGDRFTVSVGPVVPHRHPANQGVSRLFLHAKNAPAWGEVTHVNERRSFNGRVFTPPFVAVRRTSSPSDAHRAVATVVGGNEPVAVENHLIVLQPADESLASCRSALAVLRAPATDAWLNERIRCRHLTVDSLRSLPWVEGL